MINKKSVVVVAPEAYKDLGRKLSHEIGKEMKGIQCAFWTVKQYESNEVQLSRDQFAIFIGNPDENPLTKDYLDVFTNLKKEAGICLGYDSTKAVVYGEGDISQVNKFKRYIKNTDHLNKKEGAFTTKGDHIADHTFDGSNFFIFALIHISFPLLLLSYGMKKRIEKKLRTEQTKASIIVFLKVHFDKWINEESHRKAS